MACARGLSRTQPAGLGIKQSQMDATSSFEAGDEPSQNELAGLKRQRGSSSGITGTVLAGEALSVGGAAALGQGGHRSFAFNQSARGRGQLALLTMEQAVTLQLGTAGYKLIYPFGCLYNMCLTPTIAAPHWDIASVRGQS